MLEPASVATAISAFKNSIEIAKHLKGASSSIEKAEWKLKIADLLESISDSKIAFLEIRDELTEKQDEIIELKNKLKITGELIRFKDAYYFKDEEGNPKGGAICSKCWELTSTILHLTFVADNLHKTFCPNCKSIYNARRTSAINDFSICQ